MQQADCVVHLAGLAHARARGNAREQSAYDAVNHQATAILAEAEGLAGVRRFLYLSTSKVFGEESRHGGFFRSDDPPDPVGAYACSKLAAEQSLMEAARAAKFEAVIVRPPLVYGPGVRANFRRLIQVVRKGWPLPLGGVQNRRSLVSVWNLCGLIEVAIRHPGVPRQILLPTDDRPLSTPELVRLLAAAMRVRPRLMAVKPSVLLALAALVGRTHEMQALTASFELDGVSTQRLLSWQPALSVEEGIARTAREEFGS
jgi:nucleoside-diphosphate-sugar epimerase